MDCCNYVQPYSTHSHFYHHHHHQHHQHQQQQQQQQQQQHHFCYDNMNGYTTAYGSAPISDAIEANARYARLQAAYPTDYVYNPKEARLRKAMREQSREVSRQSILQSASSSTSSNSSSSSNSNSSNTSSTTTTVNTPNGTAHGISGSNAFLNHPMSCASATPTATVSSLSGNSSSYNPGRIVNPWFTVGHTPSAMKPMLSHRAECGSGFSTASATACYPSDFGVHRALARPTSNPSADGLESNDYCGIGEFSDGQKWHPYQTSTTPYHPRNPPMSAMTSRHAMQNVNHHGHGPWNQFCGVPLFSMSHSPVVRGPRHMVFLQDQQERHCGFPEEIPPMSYIPNKEPEKCIEDAPRWQPVMSAETNTNNNLVADQHEPATRTKEHHQPSSKIGDNACKEYDDASDVVQAKAPSKQPLPGFHQAFGSTEIGRFSRSEFFANMVGGDSSGLIPDSYLPVSMFPYPSTSRNLPNNIAMPRNHPAATEEIIMPNYWITPNFGIPASTSNSNYLTYFDVSHGMEGEWIHHAGQVLPQDYPATLIERPTFLFHDNCPVLAPNQLPPVVSNNEESSTGYQSTCSSDSQAQIFQDLSQNSEEKVDSTTNTNNLHDNEDNDSLINVENTDC